MFNQTLNTAKCYLFTMMHKFPNVYYNTAIESVHVSSECHWHSLIVQLFNIKTILHKFSFELILHPQPQLLSFLIKILLITLSLPFWTISCSDHLSLGNELLQCFFMLLQLWLQFPPPQ